MGSVRGSALALYGEGHTQWGGGAGGSGGGGGGALGTRRVLNTSVRHHGRPRCTRLGNVAKSATCKAPAIDLCQIIITCTRGHLHLLGELTIDAWAVRCGYGSTHFSSPPLTSPHPTSPHPTATHTLHTSASFFPSL
jgi:hypothetical protein